MALTPEEAKKIQTAFGTPVLAKVDTSTVPTVDAQKPLDANELRSQWAQLPYEARDDMMRRAMKNGDTYILGSYPEDERGWQKFSGLKLDDSFIKNTPKFQNTTLSQGRVIDRSAVENQLKNETDPLKRAELKTTLDMSPKEVDPYEKIMKAEDAIKTNERLAQMKANEYANGVDYLVRMRANAASDGPTNVFNEFYRGFARATQQAGGAVFGALEMLSENDPYMTWLNDYAQTQADNARSQILKTPELNRSSSTKNFTEGGFSDPNYYANIMGSLLPHIAGALTASVAGGLVGGGAGAVAGASAYSYSMESGSLYNDLLGQGYSMEEARSAASKYGVVAAALDSVIPAKVGGAVANTFTQGLLRQGVKQSVKQTFGKMVKEFGKDVFIEASTEAAQELAQNITQSYFDKNQDIWQNVIDSFVGGALGGGVFGIIGAGNETVQNKSATVPGEMRNYNAENGYQGKEAQQAASQKVTPDVASRLSSIVQSDSINESAKQGFAKLSEVEEGISASIRLAEVMKAKDPTDTVVQNIQEKAQQELDKINVQKQMLAKQYENGTKVDVVSMPEFTMSVGETIDGKFISHADLTLETGSEMLTNPTKYDTRAEAEIGMTQLVQEYIGEKLSTDSLSAADIENISKVNTELLSFVSQPNPQRMIRENRDVMLLAQDMKDYTKFEKAVRKNNLLPEGTDISSFYQRARSSEANYITAREARSVVEKYAKDIGVSTEFVQQLTTPQGKRALGSFMRDERVIKLVTRGEEGMPDVEITTPYHEVGHAYFQTMMSPEERANVLQEIKNNSKKELSDKQAEEILVEDLRAYNDKKTLKALKKRIQPAYARLLDSIKEIVDKVLKWVGRSSEDKINQFYEDVLSMKRPSEQIAMKETTISPEDVEFYKTKKYDSVDDFIEEIQREQLGKIDEEEIRELLSLRHDLHTVDEESQYHTESADFDLIDSYTNTIADIIEKQSLVGNESSVANKLRDSLNDMRKIDTDFQFDDEYLDLVEQSENGDIEYSEVQDYEDDYKVEALQEIHEEKEKLNDIIENYLDELDQKFYEYELDDISDLREKRNFKPSGYARARSVLGTGSDNTARSKNYSDLSKIDELKAFYYQNEESFRESPSSLEQEALKYDTVEEFVNASKEKIGNAVLDKQKEVDAQARTIFEKYKDGKRSVKKTKEDINYKSLITSLEKEGYTVTTTTTSHNIIITKKPSLVLSEFKKTIKDKNDNIVNSYEILRGNTTQTTQNKLLKFLNKNIKDGVTIDDNFSRKSDSKYITLNDDGYQFKIRISGHDLPMTYGGDAGYDALITPKGKNLLTNNSIYAVLSELNGFLKNGSIKKLTSYEQQLTDIYNKAHGESFRENNTEENFWDHFNKDEVFETLPEEASTYDESKKVGAKRISPERTSHHQLTPEASIEKLAQKMRDRDKKNFIAFSEMRDKALELQEKYGEKIPARTDGNIKKYPTLLQDRKEYVRMKENTLSSDFKSIISTLDRKIKYWESTPEKEVAIKEGAKKDYISYVKQDISKGYVFPEAVIKYHPSFTTAVNARERYNKGLRTSFSADDSRIVFSAKETIGVGMKRQDGKELTQDQKDYIERGVLGTGEALGIDMKKIAENERWVYVHLNGKNPFLMKNVAGLYRKDEANDSVSISVGGSERVAVMVDGKKKMQSVDVVISHELGHALDYKVGNKLIPYNVLSQLRATFDRNTQSRDMSYWGSFTEVTARAIEQYVAVKNGDVSLYTTGGYWSKENFDSLVKPAVEDAIRFHFSSYQVEQKNTIDEDVIDTFIEEQESSKETVDTMVDMQEVENIELKKIDEEIQSEVQNITKDTDAQDVVSLIPQEIINDAQNVEELVAKSQEYNSDLGASLVSLDNISIETALQNKEGGISAIGKEELVAQKLAQKKQKDFLKVQEKIAKLTDKKIKLIQKQEAEAYKKTERQRVKNVARMINLVDRKRMKDLETEITMSDKQYLKDMYKAQAKGANASALETARIIKQKLRETRKYKEMIGKVEALRQRVRASVKTGGRYYVEYARKLLAVFDEYDTSSLSNRSMEKLQDIYEMMYNNEQISDEMKDWYKKNIERVSKKSLREMTYDEVVELYTMLSSLANKGAYELAQVQYFSEQEKERRIALAIESTKNMDGEGRKGTTRAEMSQGAFKEALVRTGLDVLTPVAVMDKFDGNKNFTGWNAMQIKSLQKGEQKWYAQLHGATEELKIRIQEIKPTFTAKEETFLSLVARSREEADGAVNNLLLQLGVTDGVIPAQIEGITLDQAEQIIDIIEEISDKYEISTQLKTIFEARTNKPFPIKKHYIAPLKYTNRITDTTDADIEALQNFADYGTEVGEGMAISRMEKVNLEVRTDLLTLVTEGWNHSLYYINMQPRVDNIQSVVGSKEFKESAGRIVSMYWKEYLSEVANKGKSMGQGTFDVILRNLRQNFQVAILGFKVSTILTQPTAGFNAAMTAYAMHGTDFALSIMGELAQAYIVPSYAQDALSQSEALTIRAGSAGSTDFAEINKLMETGLADLRGNYSKLKAGAIKAGMYMIQEVDIRTAAAVWNGMYNKFIEKGMSDEKARAEADFFMSLSQSSTQIVDRPLILSRYGEFGRLFFTFQTFSLGLWSMITQGLVVNGIMKGTPKVKIKSALALLAIPFFTAFAGEMISIVNNAIKGKDDDEDMEDKLKNALENTWVELVATVPLFGSIIKGKVLYNRSYEVPLVGTGIELIGGIEGLMSAQDYDDFMKNLMTLGKTSSIFAGIPGAFQATDVINRFVITEKEKKQIETRAIARAYMDAKEVNLDKYVTDLIMKLYTKEEIKNLKSTTKTTLKTNILKEVVRLGKNDEAKNVLKLSKNEEKADYLKEIRDQYTPAEFKQLVNYLKKYKVLSDDAELLIYKK